jgi:NAD+ synthase/NAD+ synthase (glutamine-hydrolysing)
MKTILSIAVVQLDFVVGDLCGNADRIIAAIGEARARGADLVLTPELSLTGYPPEDLLLRDDFYRACNNELHRVAAATDGIYVVIGHPEKRGGVRYNVASVVRDRQIIASYCKQSLSNAGVFDEKRYYAPGSAPCVFGVNGRRIGINICEDVWDSAPVRRARSAGAEILLVLSASPFYLGKRSLRYDTVRARIAETGMPILYCNLVGGQDELVFDGASFALDRDGRLVFQSASFEERIDIVTWSKGRWSDAVKVENGPLEAEAWGALTTGIRDYLRKNDFPGAIVNLSGGIDSALTLVAAIDALGAERVRAVVMPSPCTARVSVEEARAIAERLGVRCDEIPIEAATKVFARLLTERFGKHAADTAEENLRSRIRGMLLMALSNESGDIVLTTDNKSEMAIGCVTSHGDMAGGFAVLKDIYATMVHRLADWRNAQPGGAVIPPNIVDRPSSAELEPGRRHQNGLPPHDVLDAIIEAYMERNESPRQIIAAGYSEQDVRRTVTMLRRNEYKRRQAPVGIRMTPRGFGKDWRYPITSHYRDEF